MSNRLIQIGRVPLIPDPQVALKASQVFSANRDRTERVLELGTAYLNLLSTIRDGVLGFTKTVERAIQIRSLSTMDDKALADIGVRRDQLPRYYEGNSIDALVRKQSSAWLRNNER